MTKIGMALDPASERARIARQRRRERLRPWGEGLIGFLAIAILATGIWVQTANTSTAVDGDALLAELADDFAASDTVAAPVTPSEAAADPASATDTGGQAAEPSATAGDESAPPAGATTQDESQPAAGDQPAAEPAAPAQDSSAAEEQPPAPPQPEFVLPAEGVYTYATEGYESLSIAGARHDYPEESFIVVRHEGGCQFSLDHRILEEKRAKNTNCSEGPLISKVRYDGQVTFFGQTEESNYTCEGTVADLRDTPGASHVGRCTDENRDAESVDQITFVGVETMDIGGVTVEALHYHQESELRGDIRGTGTSDYWYHPDTGLPLRIERRTQSFANAFGGDVEYNEDATFQLLSLEPRR